METIEVTWKTKPASGITELTFEDLGVKDIEEWNSLPKSQQERRINNALTDSDGGELKAVATEWHSSTESY